MGVLGVGGGLVGGGGLSPYVGADQSIEKLKVKQYNEREFLFKLIKMIKNLIKMKTNFPTGQNKLGLRR